MNDKLKKQLEEKGYFTIVEIPNRGICSLYRFAFTVGLVYNINNIGYEGRYCYENLQDAIEAIINWDGIEDPKDSNWIKHKGENGEYKNINYEQD